LLRDWEELPDGFDAEWEAMISKILNANAFPLTSPGNAGNAGRGLFDSNTFVLNDRNIPIADVRIGDFIRDAQGFTRVLGVYRDETADHTAAWYYNAIKKVWTHLPASSSQGECKGYQLITESGTFLVVFDSIPILVRDFTEVGAENIHKTYAFTAKCLNN
jgi:hypothetical protein